MEEAVAKNIPVTSDWLASDPVFYNEKSGAVSHNINEVIDINSFKWHAEGLNNYLDFGYSVFEQTPIEHVKFLRHSAILEQGSPVKYLDDEAEAQMGNTTREEDVIQLLQNSISQWEKQTTGPIVIPTSGGYDSRLLNNMIDDKSRIRSFTYGISREQSESFEVVYAKKIAEILGTNWQQIPLGSFHHYFNDWHELYGVATHAHGMYQMEFYEKICAQVNIGAHLLSGIIGDAWAGSVEIPAIDSAPDVIKLGYAHGINADSTYSRLRSSPDLLNQYFHSNKEKLRDPRFRVVESMRFKILLLSYLLRVPAKYGLQPWSPFLLPQIALPMLNLPPARKKDRLWQVDYFKKHGLYIESLNLTISKKNVLDSYGSEQVPVTPLDPAILQEIIQPAYIHWVNKHIGEVGSLRKWLDKLTYYPKIGGALRRLGVKDVQKTAYLAYQTLKPLETLIKQRNKG